MTRRDTDKIAAGLKRAADDIVSRSGSQKPRLIFHFDCCGRGKVILQESTKHKFLNDIQQKIGLKKPAGLLITGNRSESAEYYARVRHESHLILTLASFAAQVSSVLRNIHLYSELEKEKNLLEIRVMERTRELSEAKNATGSCSMAMEGFFRADRRGRIP